MSERTDSRAANPRALDREEAAMVAQSQALDGLSPSELTELVRRLRARRDRVQAMIRARQRRAEKAGTAAVADVGAREKKAILTGAVARVSAKIERLGFARDAARAARNLRAAVARKADNPPWRGPEDHTAATGPAETPNLKIAPSGALHAEGMRAAIARATGDR